MRTSVAAAAKRLDQAQAVAFVLLLARLGRGRRRRPPLSTDATFEGTISVVVPARDEAQRIGPCLDGLRADADLRRSSSSTTARPTARPSWPAAAARASSEPGRRREAGSASRGRCSEGWSRRRGDVVVALDADTRAAPGLARALAARLAEADLVSAGARFVCDTAGRAVAAPGVADDPRLSLRPAGQPRGGRDEPPGHQRAVHGGPPRAMLAAGGYAGRGRAHDRRRRVRPRACRARLARRLP